MNVFPRIIGREYGRRPTLSFDHSLSRLQNYSVDVSGDTEDPFLSLALNEDRLVVASEKGHVRIVKTSTSYSFDMKVVNEFQAHFNAIFDIKWRPGFAGQVVTVSADQSFSLWDTSSQDCLHGNAILTQKAAHLSSIKSCSFADSNVFATGSRDGNVRIWDLRLASSSSSCIKVITDAHPGPLSVTAKGANRKNTKNVVVRSSPLSCVTAVLFQPNSMNLFTTGASDAVIKLWDIRKLKPISAKPTSGKNAVQSAIPVSVFSTSGNKSFASGHGFSSLATDSKCRVYASCSDHRVYAYESKSGKLAATFSGNSYRTNNFTRIAIINDYLVSGSVEGSPPVWSLKSLQSGCKDFKPIVTLNHHEEVTAVAGNDSTMEIFTCSDDQKLHKWSLLGRSLDPKQTEPAGQARHRIAKPYVENDVELEDIIVKTNSLTTSPSRVAESTAISPKRSSTSPLTTLTGWLTPNVDNTPQSSQSISKKRSLSKENLENTQSSISSTPSSRQEVKESASEPKAKKSKTSAKKAKKPLFTPSTKKISDYFHR